MLLPIDQLPSGYNSTNQFVVVKGGAVRFIAFVEKAFGASERTSVRTPDTDGSLIHAEVVMGNATIMIADSKDDWPFTPAFIQVYVRDAQQVLDLAASEGAEIVTGVSDFYGGFKLARFKDPFHNIWWIYEPNPEPDKVESSNTAWHDKKPSEVYTTIMSAMQSLAAPPSRGVA